jgi:hypothetical protein
MEHRPRVVVAFPDVVESQLLAEWLSEEHDPSAARLLAAAVHQIRSRQPQLVVADARFVVGEALLSICRGHGAATPLVVVGDPNPAAEAAAERHGAYYLRRPVDRETLLCTAAMALVDSRPVRRSPRKPVARFEALAEGHPCSLIDVSNEGMRLAIPRGSRSALPPFFTVRVPLVGLTLLVQRIWLAAPSPDAAFTWCGGALAQNGAREDRSWRRFVDLIPRSA